MQVTEISVSGANTSKRIKVINKYTNADNSSSSSDVIATTKWQWTTNENNPTIWKCTETPMVSDIITQSVRDDISVYEAFHQFLDNDFWHMVSRETNKYAYQYFQNPNYKKKLYDDK